MKLFKKIMAVSLAAALSVTCLAGCSSGQQSGGDEVEAAKEIRYLNFKPEIADVYQEIAEKYEAETGVKVIVETAANNTYEQTLTAKMGTSEAPTIFQINGPRGYANWADYCADLTDTELYQHLTDKSLAVTVDGKAYGIPYVVEGYGIIYNQAIMDKYFALEGKATSYTSVDEINNFAKLKEVVEDMQKNKDALGIDGVFANTSLKPGEDWRWQTHLANLPVYYEFKNNNVDLTSDQTKTLNFQYAENFKNIFDLYLNNSTIEASKLGTKTVADSMSEFALEKCAMVQNGNWAWSQVADVKGNKVQAENVKYLPIYTGVEGEESQGLCVGTENFFCINSQASEAEQKAAEDFIYWLYSSETGKDYVTNKLGFIAPFDTFEEDEKPTDPLAKEVLNWMSKDGVTSVPWNFTLFPSQTFKDNFGAALLQYAQGTKTFDEVKEQVISDWASESAAAE
ncbi:MAG: ABC transporter substrate-binding protein [Eubacteriales bacterium]|nr:ABC transporter substrate-binding protein [Eubacteriales bacterium]